MNKGTAIVGFFVCFLAGMFLMWGIDRSGGASIGAEGAVAAGSVDHADAVIPVTKDDPQWGNSDALVTIVEISDFECPFCSRVNPTMQGLKDKYGPDKIRIVWKHNPLPFHKKAEPAHEASAAVHAVAGSEAFWKFHDLAFANQKDLTPENFDKWAKEAGADPAKFKAAIDSKKYAAKVKEDQALARKIGASGTPAFRINGVTLSGAQPQAKFEAIIDEQLAEAQKLIASGTPKTEVYKVLTAKNANVSEKAEDKPEERQEPPEDNTVWKVPVSDDDPQKGPKDALVTIVEWSEFQCPFCKRVGPTINQVFETYPKDVRVVWKDNPLPFHPRAKPTANFARVAYKLKGDKGFWDAHDALFESQPKLEDEDLKGIADKLGIPWGTAKQAIDGDTYAAKFDESMELAMDLKARGTPHFFVNGIRVQGAQPFDKFKEVIDAQLKKAQALVAKGTPRAQVYDEVMKEGQGPPPPEKKEVPAPPKDAPFMGGANAKVVIQEFSDFECPFCKRVTPTLEEIKKEYGNKVKIVWRHMPLEFHKKAPLASEAAHEAYVQKGNDAFWKFHDKVFESQGTPDALTRESLDKIAQELGLDMTKFKTALDNRTHKARIDADVEVARQAQISGTPAFTINGYFINGAQPAPAFKKLINRALKEAGG